jgi:hypothetical protein
MPHDGCARLGLHLYTDGTTGTSAAATCRTVHCTQQEASEMALRAGHPTSRTHQDSVRSANISTELALWQTRARQSILSTCRPFVQGANGWRMSRPTTWRSVPASQGSPRMQQNRRYNCRDAASASCAVGWRCCVYWPFPVAVTSKRRAANTIHSGSQFASRQDE